MVMQTLQIPIEDELKALLHSFNQPVEKSARELMILELYRRGSISSGKAGELLGMSRRDFIQHASRLGIPYFEMTEDEWSAERARANQL